jgi:hypothetical protein
MATNLKILAQEMGVERRALSRMIAPIAHKLRYKQEKRRTLTPREELFIREHLGLGINQTQIRFPK